jgi:RNA polymerase sigma factor (sigma-70 family)
MAIPPDQPATAADNLPIRALLEERRLLLAYISVFARDRDAAEDILQEAMLLALRQRFDRVDHARAWIRVTSRNLAFSEGRRRQRRVTLLPEDVLELLDPVWDDEADSPPHDAQLAALRECFKHLSAAGKRLIDLRFFQGLDGEGVAKALGRPLNTVYVGLSRVYRRLAACIERRLERT